MRVTSLDLPVACISTNEHAATAFPAPLKTLTNETINGIEFNIYNNIWDTNFIFWYPYLEEDANFKARFRIDFLWVSIKTVKQF